MAAIGDCEISPVHSMYLEITMVIVHCNDRNCKHETYLYIFYNNGFFHICRVLYVIFML